MKNIVQSRSRKFAAIGLGLVSALTGAAQAANFSPAHVLNAFKTPYATSPYTVGIIAHRGVTDSGCPENSDCSLLNTINHGIESIELDVKQSANGTPWLLHDQNVGRLFNHNPNYNIFTNSGWNPDIHAMLDTTIDSYYLRDKNFNATIYKPVTAFEVMNTVQLNYNHVLLVFDIKTLDAVSKIADFAVSHGMQNQVVLKFSASLLGNNPSVITAYTKGVAFVPTIYTGDEDRIINDGFQGSCQHGDYQCRVRLWLTTAFAQRGFAWVEVGNKQIITTDPTYFLYDDQKLHQKPMGAFNPVKEYSNGYVRSNGSCCASLNDYLSRSIYFGTEHFDNRENAAAQYNNGFTTVITDDALGVAMGTVSSGHRFPNRYF